MTLAFYKVDNSRGYERHTFDMWCDRPQVIKEILSELKDDELRMYDMDNKHDVDFFQEDFNDEYLEPDWWCVVIND